MGIPLGLLTTIATDKGLDRYSSIYAEAKKLLADYPTIKHVLNSAENGHSVKDKSVCALKYSRCPFKADELLDNINDLGDISTLFFPKMSLGKWSQMQ